LRERSREALRSSLQLKAFFGPAEVAVEFISAMFIKTPYPRNKKMHLSFQRKFHVSKNSTPPNEGVSVCLTIQDKMKTQTIRNPEVQSQFIGNQ
jgi:hypothetical protein